jgi:photosystem II stability/assembly factor-like uncharacterized protein
VKSFLSLAAALFLFILLSPPASAQQIQSMKLLTPQVGWATSGNHLYWTTDDGGHWKDIAPPMSPKESLSGVFFLDTSTGWVVLSYPDDKAEQQFRVASTSNAGAAWSSSPIKVPGKRFAEDLFGGGGIFFLDQLHGWVNLGIYSSSAFKRGMLLATDDGGKTWKAPPGDSGMGGTLCFFSEKDGVLAGGPQDTELWVTHDASKSWQELSLKATPEAAPADQPTYGEPICEDAKSGFLPVTFSKDGSPSALVLFATDDGGRTWKSERTQSGLEDLGPLVSSTVAGSDLIFAPPQRGGKALELTTIPATGRSNSIATRVAGSASVSQLSFMNSSTGWASTDDALLSTTDGGATWTNITPNRIPTRAQPPVTPRIKPARPSSDLRFPVSPTQNSAGRARPDVAWTEIHLGFDVGNAPSVSKMQTWWNYSPYYDYQISLPGAANHPKNANLTP